MMDKTPQTKIPRGSYRRGRLLLPTELRTLRLAADLSPEMLANLLGCSVQTILNLEAGTGRRVSHTFDKLLTFVLFPKTSNLFHAAQAYREKMLHERENL